MKWLRFRKPRMSEEEIERRREAELAARRCADEMHQRVNRVLRELAEPPRKNADDPS